MTEPKVLAFYLGPRDAYRDVLFSHEEVFCSPDCSTKLEADRSRTFQTPLGQYDVRVVLGKLPRAHWPDIIVVKADGTRRNLPGNLRALDCPKVLVLGDTHHLRSPIRTLLNYAMSERFDVILTETNRQHVHFFQSAGFSRVYWFPNLSWAPEWHDVHEEAAHGVVFVGQTGPFHPWRRALLRAVERRGLPVLVEGLPRREAAARYAVSKVVLNCSLNGDVNLRTFEVLAAGGLLLTDKLTTDSGMSLLFENGRDLVTYSSPDDLVDKARYYLEHHEAALAIRRAGRARIEANHSPEIQRRRFFDLVLRGRVDSMLEVNDQRRAPKALPVSQLVSRVAAYEWVQELHRKASSVRLLCSKPELPLAEDARDLPRINVTAAAGYSPSQAERPVFTAPPSEPATEYVLAMPAGLPKGAMDDHLAAFHGRSVVLDGAFATLSYGELSAYTASLAAWGFALVDPIAFAFQRADPVASLTQLKRSSPEQATVDAIIAILDESDDADACYAAGVASLELGDPSLPPRCFEKAARLDRNHAPAVEALARVRPHVRPTHPTAHRQRNGPRRRYLIVTNLFPPEELGGYGRKIHSFARCLAERGHEVRVVTGSAPYLERIASDDPSLPIRVDRSLRLTGKWEDGTMKVLGDRAAVQAVAAHNGATVVAVQSEFRPDICLLGNIDFLEMDLLRALLAEGIPVLHSIGSPTPGYPVTEAPRLRSYRAIPASGWVADELRKAGYPFEVMTIAHPGAQLSDFQRDLQPWPSGLRIAYAGLMLPFKGPQVLLQALALLHHQGIEFRCEMAGDTTSPQFVAMAEEFIAKSNLSGKVQLLGFQDRAGLRRLFDRSNVFVFPSLVPEAFGISQVEAMAAGLSIVTTATGGAREVVDNDCALLVAPNNPMELADRLLALHDDPRLCEHFGERARARATRFSVDAGVDYIEAAANELLGGAS